MDDFLKDRPVLDPKSSLMLSAEPKPAVSMVKPPAIPVDAVPPAQGSSPFGDLRRDPAPSGRPAASKQMQPSSGSAEIQLAAQAAPQTLKGEHGTKVQTIVERGRVTKIIVTCTCGTVTEIACQY